MSQLQIVYWSQTGNTEKMAQAIVAGAKAAGADAAAIEVGQADLDVLKGAAAFALGCPSMGVEELDDAEMEPFVQQVEGFAAGKKIALFGSYGWGDGQWMRDWAERMEKAGAQVVGGEGLICQDEPDDTAVAACEQLGATLATLA